MMMTVQTIRATTRAPSESAMSVWKTYDAMMSSMDSALSSKKKRPRDSFEAYDFQVHHKQQRMRYQLPQKEPIVGVYPNDSLVSLQRKGLSKPPSFVPPSFEPSKELSRQSSKSDDIRKTRRNKSEKKSTKRSTQRMTKKHYNKKKRFEMMEATNKHIQSILGSSNVERTVNSLHRVKYYRKKAEQLDRSLRDQCNSIVYKEQDIKSWLGMTTRSRSQIISLRKRLHERWAEVKDLQTLVKPRRQRLKNLKFAMLCEERSIEEETP